MILADSPQEEWKGFVTHMRTGTESEAVRHFLDVP